MKKIRSEDNIYEVIEKALSASEVPMTCADLMDIHEVRKAALKRFGDDLQLATNKMSDLLGFMWRRTILERYQAPPSRSMARYAYMLASKADEPVPTEIIPPPAHLRGKQKFTVSEQNGDVVIDFPNFTIRVTSK